MTNRFRALALAGVSAACMASAAGDAQAGAFAIREQSTQAQGMSFAGAAAGSGGVSSMFWNPAVITMRPGFVAEQNLTYIQLQARERVAPGTNPFFAALGDSGDIGQGAVVPAGATSRQLNENLWLGLATGAPFGLVTKPRQFWAGEAYGRSSRIFSLAFNPVIAYKVNDWFSVAAGPIAQYFRLTLRQAQVLPAVVAPPSLYPSSFLKGDSWGAGFTAGFTLTSAATGTIIGAGYRSSIHHEIDGSVGLPPIVLALPGGAAQALAAGQVRAKFNTPDKVSAGITQAITPTLRANFGFEWDNWSRAGDIAVVSKRFNVPITSLPLNYKDGYLFTVGAEYDWSPALTVRGGFGYEISPIDFQNRSVRLPDNDRYIASIGASYRWSEKLTLNIAYSHFFLDKSSILAGLGRDYNVNNIAFASTVDSSADIVSVGFRYVFDAPAPAAVPIVRKY